MNVASAGAVEPTEFVVHSSYLPALAAAVKFDDIDVFVANGKFHPEDTRTDRVLMVALLTEDDIAFAGQCATESMLEPLQNTHPSGLSEVFRQSFGLTGNELLQALLPDEAIQEPVEGVAIPTET